MDKIRQFANSLLLPIALLPIAGILLRLGQTDLLDIKFIMNAGNVIFLNLPILFAIGVSIGLSKDNNGTSALAAAVGYLIMITVLNSFNKDLDTGVLGGILIGIISAILYNRYKDIKLPEYLVFFGGKRFVPIITGLVAVIFGIILGYVWPFIQHGVNIFGAWLISLGGIGLFLYGILNRLLSLMGLHHILNNLVWFVFGNYSTSTGQIFHGDIPRFMNGDPTAGSYTSGFFPIMIFGLPAACLAMYKSVSIENRQNVSGIFISMALTALLTGVTDPIELSFVFIAPGLFIIHAILTGISMSLMYILNVKLGFIFSAGLLDYIMFFKQSTHPLYLFPIGFGYFTIYFFTFYFYIKKFNIATIGR